MMVIHEHFATRKPLEYTLLVLFIILLLLLPVYWYTSKVSKERQQSKLLAESFSETNFYFGPDSDLSDHDKKTMFKISYEGNTVQWLGRLVSCERMNIMYKVQADLDGDSKYDIYFSTYDDCSRMNIGDSINFRTKLVDYTVGKFVGADSQILE